MMAFNPNPFAHHAQLLAQQPTTPLKTDPDAASDMMRFLAANSSNLMAQYGLQGMPGNPQMEAFRALMPPNMPIPLMYPQINMPDFNAEMLQGGGPMLQRQFFEMAGFHPYGLDNNRRKNATRETTAELKRWLNTHRKNPYPTKGDKIMLAMVTKMTLTQVSTWFANARRRLKKENKWSPPARRGEGEEDDDLDGEGERAGSRAGSSIGNLSDNDDVDMSITAADKESDTPLRGDVTPKKKIWSIVDSIEEKKEKEEDKEQGSSKKDSPSSDDSMPPISQQQHNQMMAAMFQMRLPPQMLAAMAAQQAQQAMRTAGSPHASPMFNFPFNPLMMAAFAQPPPNMNGSFSSEAASVSPNSSHSPSENKNLKLESLSPAPSPRGTSPRA